MTFCRFYRNGQTATFTILCGLQSAYKRFSCKEFCTYDVLEGGEKV